LDLRYRKHKTGISRQAADRKFRQSLKQEALGTS
jgi:hypothetical protein